MTSIQLLTSFLGRLQDLLAPQEFSNYVSMDTRIRGIIDFLRSLDAPLNLVYPGREHRWAYLTNARNRLANTLLLTVFDPTSESRQFYNRWGSVYFSEHSELACPKVLHIQSTLGAVMRELTIPVLFWRRLLSPMHVDSEQFLRSNNSNRDICVRAANVALELLLYRRATDINIPFAIAYAFNRTTEIND
ncbi:hypothetical protein C8F01DRAFT_1361215, partial [Mycena amicta]